ncbi:tRNA-intron endonuclease [Aureococcus anophagefferens]|nr:tRNA-intron endonuclease [Aureococcus anophagefferens]
MCYLAARDRVIVRETSDGDALDTAEIRRRCGAWAPLGDVRFDATLAVYAHFRDKKWIVKDGLQFGADFVLYRRSPDVFHAEYCVVVAERDEIDDAWPPLAARRLASFFRRFAEPERAFFFAGSAAPAGRPRARSAASGRQSGGGCLRSVTETRGPEHAEMQCFATVPALPPRTRRDRRGQGTARPTTGSQVDSRTQRNAEPTSMGSSPRSESVEMGRA